MHPPCQISSDFVPTYLAELAFWPAFQALNFWRVPVRHQARRGQGGLGACRVGGRAWLARASGHPVHCAPFHQFHPFLCSCLQLLVVNAACLLDATFLAWASSHEGWGGRLANALHGGGGGEGKAGAA